MTPKDTTPLVELRQVGKVYSLGERSITALQAVSLRIFSGEFVAIWGPSGSGKSTLCNLIGMLDVPSSGTVQILGQDVTMLSDGKRSDIRNKTIGFVFQSFNLIPVLSALENVMLPLQIAKIPTMQAKQLAKERLAEVGLAEHESQRPAKLSGGQQQRVAIARALVANPSLVIADEPTANLDSENAIKVIETMRELSQRNGTTFIFSTHDHRLLERVERQLQMCDGQIIEDRIAEPTESCRRVQVAL
ncbi:ATP-binding cassette domain-containing protein [Methylococcus geothermalis]|uniref:ATP-binding cassette domain-containing protein n=2 Tax=Methylococcus geothermalis TaxID=2681310 RepID=A0A858QCH5_9GAMM|nr:ATP-binding cassette domain-containing protein [Methylococcus geothermalis]